MLTVLVKLLDGLHPNLSCFVVKPRGTRPVPPVEEQGDELKVIHKSVSASIKNMNTSRLNRLINNNLTDDDVRKCLVKQSEIDEDVCHKIVDKLESNGGHMDRDEWDNMLEEYNIA